LTSGGHGGGGDRTVAPGEVAAPAVERAGAEPSVAAELEEGEIEELELVEEEACFGLVVDLAGFGPGFLRVGMTSAGSGRMGRRG
jgi:hypothetical protein